MLPRRHAVGNMSPNMVKAEMHGWHGSVRGVCCAVVGNTCEAHETRHSILRRKELAFLRGSGGRMCDRYGHGGQPHGIV